MDSEDPIKRNEKGDIELDDFKVDWKQINKSRYTYVFKFFDSEIEHYKPYFDLFSKSEAREGKAKNDPDYFEAHLYKTPDKPPFDFYIHYNNWQLELMLQFFKEVFEERAFIDGHIPSHKYYRLILPKTLYYEIVSFINEFELLPIKDLICELIAIAQDKYTEHIAFWERVENQRLLNTAAKEAEKTKKVIEKINYESWVRCDNGHKQPPRLKQIAFVFNDETIKIEHSWIAGEFIEHFKKYYNDLPLKNWRKELDRYHEHFEDNINKGHFKYKLAKSFYNLLIGSGLFKV
ncbi:MAG TPA: hypothetical protein VHC47_02410, partial [Mucilaginibacter sp.]|nr:hypothetical protein [Mucilaginibacter sp.]